MATLSEKRAAFRRLHESGCFVMPNPWDVGSARYLQHLGFPALASTSAGYAWSQGLADGAVDRDRLLKHLAELSEGVDLPVNADFEAGFAETPAGVDESVSLALAAGVSGLSIEDYSGQALYDLETALARLRAARAAIDAAGGGVVLTGRSEGFIRGRPDLDETLARLRAYAEAGADCLYAPGITTPEQVSAIVAAVAPKPVNVLVGSAGAFTVADLAALGVRRISVGGALARTAWAGFMAAAGRLARDGDFGGLAAAAPTGEIVRAFPSAG
jgi:2-methylisocitrate lyase-like PEP mutase family enzyme